MVDGLITRPPMNDGDLARRLRGVDPDEARREIVDRFFDGGAPSAFGLLSAALLHLGVEGQEARLERLAADTTRSRPERWTAISLLFSASTARADRVLGALGPDDRLELVLQPAAEAIAEVMTEPAAAGATIAEALAAVHPEVLGDAFAYLDGVRRGAGTPAVLTYREALRRAELAAVRDLALEAVVREGGPSAATALTELRDGAKDPGARQALQRALLRLGTRAIEAAPATPPARGKGYLGSCDGQGAFIVLGCFENADGSTTIADLCAHAGGEVRDGFAASALDDAAVAELLAQMRAGGTGDVAPLPLAEAAAIALDGVERTRRDGAPIPDDALPALLLFERARGGAIPDPSAPAARGPVTRKEARALLSLPIYETWFFDAGDFVGAGVKPPEWGRRKPKPDWFEAALARLEASEVRPRLTAMLDHMARWHARRGEGDRAAICAAAAGEARAQFRAGALPRVMLERSVEVQRAAMGPRAGVIGDPEARDRIRLAFFRDVNEPKGKDLAGLDLTEAALEALRGAFDALPGSRRPREDDLQRAAFALGTIFARYLLSRKKPAPEVLVEEMGEAASASTKLAGDERRAVMAAVLAALAGFVEEVCERCPVSCLGRPKAGMADAFFAVEHPAFG